MKTPDEFAELMSDKAKMSNGDRALPTEQRQVFEVTRPPALVSVLVIALALTLFFSIEEAREIDYLGACLFALGFVFFLLMTAVSVASLSDIVVDNTGISRVALGRTWRKIRWCDVSVIKVFDVADRATSRTTRAFNIYPVVRPKFALSGKICFGEEIERRREFFNLMNKYIVEHSVKIESTTGGIRTSPTNL